jgi:hypothetical protein
MSFVVSFLRDYSEWTRAQNIFYLNIRDSWSVEAIQGAKIGYIEAVKDNELRNIMLRILTSPVGSAAAVLSMGSVILTGYELYHRPHTALGTVFKLVIGGALATSFGVHSCIAFQRAAADFYHARYGLASTR